MKIKSDPRVAWTFAALLAIALAFSFFNRPHVVEEKQAVAAPSPKWEAVQDRMWDTFDSFLTKENARKVIILLVSGTIGGLGSLAYFWGVKLGFIDRENRAAVMEFLAANPYTFAFYGAVVAAVFQMSENVLVPIQSFVMGTTWPAVVTRLKASNGDAGPRGAGLTNLQVAELTPPGESGNLRDVQVSLP